MASLEDFDPEQRYVLEKWEQISCVAAAFAWSGIEQWALLRRALLDRASTLPR